MPAPFPICYLNGAYVPLHEARISPLDRGFLFADSVYEVWPVFDGRPYRLRAHLDRLARSLREIRATPPLTDDAWLAIIDNLVERNDCHTCYMYAQVTRGMEFGRNHAFPANAQPTVFVLCAPLPELTEALRTQGASAITVEDFRWARCDIKSTMLLANVLMKQAASDLNAHEAIIVREGAVLEGSSTSVFAVIDGTLVTPPNGPHILPGTTRDAVLDLAHGHIPTRIRSLTVQELFTASEVWLSAATRDVLPVTRIDGRSIGAGTPGPLWRQMLEWFAADRRRLAGTPAL